MDYLQPPDRQRRSSNDEFSDEDDEDIDFNPNPETLSEGHHIRKRSSDVQPLFYTPTYCKTLGFCSLMPTLSAICLVKCNFHNISLFQPFLGLLPELPTLLCQSVNTMFASLPKQIRLSAFRIPNLKAYLKVLNVKQDDVTDFAKTSANALAVAMIKNVRYPIFDQLKPAMKHLEIHDTDKKKTIVVGSLFKKLIGSPFTLNLGQFINQKCDKTNFDDEALLLIAAMKTRKCAMDIVMPGYFVFNAAPKVASTRRILPLLRAWNMPLFMFTGVKCCMVKFAVSGRRSKCVLKYDLLDKPHGLPRQNGPDTVCYAIPEYKPFIPFAKATLVPRGFGMGRENTTEVEETTTTVSPCDDEENKGELEECVTESTSVEYSEEATESQPEESTTEATEGIQSDEAQKEY